MYVIRDRFRDSEFFMTNVLLIVQLKALNVLLLRTLKNEQARKCEISVEPITLSTCLYNINQVIYK